MSYDSEVLADTPAGYWKLQETSGTTAADSSGNARNGTIYSASATTGFGTGCTANQASLLLAEPSAKSFLFSRTGSATDSWGTGGATPNAGGIGRVEVPYNAVWNMNATSFSVECWFKTAVVTTDFPTSLINNRHYDSALVARRQSAPAQFALRVTNAGSILASLWSGPDTNSANSWPGVNVVTANHNYVDYVAGSSALGTPPSYLPATPPYTTGPLNGQPHHVVMVVDNTNNIMRLYVDGVENFYAVNIPNNFVASNTTDALQIGATLTAGLNGFIGWMSHVAVYRSALSAGRVLSHYIAGSGNRSIIHIDYYTESPYSSTLSENVSINGIQVNYDNPLLSESLTVVGTPIDFLPVSITLAETINIANPQNSPAQTFADTIAHTVNFTSPVDNLRSLEETLAQSVNVGSTISLGQILLGALRENINIRLGFSTPTGEYVGWTMNSNTGAVSMYDNFSYNSFAKIGTKYYGAKATGIYELTGARDVSTAIDATVTLPNTDFGAPNLKRVAHAYLGIRADGGVQLRVVTNDGDSNTYILDRENGVVRESRVDIGRGLRSRYWQFELKNEDGADFELDEIELFLDTTVRRI